MGRIVEMAFVKVMPDGQWHASGQANGQDRLLINPEMPIPAESSAVHGISKRLVKEADVCLPGQPAALAGRV